MSGLSTPVAVVPILPTPRFTPVAALMLARQLVATLSVLTAQILMHLAILSTVHSLVVCLIVLGYDVIMGAIVTFNHALVPISMTVVVAVAIVSITVAGVAIAPRADGD